MGKNSGNGKRSGKRVVKDLACPSPKPRPEGKWLICRL